MSEPRYALVGAHLRHDDVDGIPGVTAFDVPPVVISAVPYDPDRGLADPTVVQRALEARKQLMERSTFVAIRFGASARDAADVTAKCAPFAAAWRNILETRGDAAEFTIRIAGTSRPGRPDRHAFQSGSEYLRALQKQRHGQFNPATRNTIHQAFSGLAIEERWIAREDGGTEYVALINRKDLGRVRKVAEKLQDDLRSVPFLLSGPWPLEVFAEEG